MYDLRKRRSSFNFIWEEYFVLMFFNLVAALSLLYTYYDNSNANYAIILYIISRIKIYDYIIKLDFCSIRRLEHLQNNYLIPPKNDKVGGKKVIKSLTELSKLILRNKLYTNKLIKYDKNEGRTIRLICYNDLYEDIDLDNIVGDKVLTKNDLNGQPQFVQYELLGGDVDSTIKNMVLNAQRLFKDKKKYEKFIYHNSIKFTVELNEKVALEEKKEIPLDTPITEIPLMSDQKFELTNSNLKNISNTNEVTSFTSVGETPITEIMLQKYDNINFLNKQIFTKEDILDLETNIPGSLIILSDNQFKRYKIKTSDKIEMEQMTAILLKNKILDNLLKFTVITNDDLRLIKRRTVCEYINKNDNIIDDKPITFKNHQINFDELLDYNTKLREAFRNFHLSLEVEFYNIFDEMFDLNTTVLNCLNENGAGNTIINAANLYIEKAANSFQGGLNLLARRNRKLVNEISDLKKEIEKLKTVKKDEKKTALNFKMVDDDEIMLQEALQSLNKDKKDKKENKKEETSKSASKINKPQTQSKRMNIMKSLDEKEIEEFDEKLHEDGAKIDWEQIDKASFNDKFVKLGPNTINELKMYFDSNKRSTLVKYEKVINLLSVLKYNPEMGYINLYDKKGAKIFFLL